MLGHSHSGNLSAREAVQAGAIDVLCSDYYPAALLDAVFTLRDQCGLDIAKAFALVTINPAKAAGIADEVGSIAVGKRADVLLVRDVSRATMLRVIGKYKAGHYAQLPELIRHFRCRRVHIRCDRESEINLDGELMMSRDVTFEIAPQSIRFFYPRGLTYHAAAEQGGEHIAAT